MRFIYLTFVFLSLASCSSGGEKENPSITAPAPKNVQPVSFDTSLKAGQIIENVVCKSNPSQSYTLYLPSGYTPKKPWPVIYAFDPHAKGNNPVSKYNKLAEQYGYIIAASNNSKNGLPWDSTQGYAKTMINDLSGRVNTDGARNYALGFSGGAKVASSVAIFDGGITGVIGCGAGFPENAKEINNRFYYYGIVGDGDFNYGSMVALEETMQATKMPHQFSVFYGKHEWPGKDIMEDAFLYMQFNAVRDNKQPRNDSVIKAATLKYSNNLIILKRAGTKYEAYLLCKKAINILINLGDVSVFAKELETLSADPEVKKTLEGKEGMLKKESQLQQQYAKQLTDKDLNWWENEINRLQQAAKTEKDKEQAGLDKRLVAFIGILSFSNATNALGQNNLQAAGVLIKILEATDPKNSDVPYLTACLLARQNKLDNALNELKKAIALGFDDKGRMETEPALAGVRMLPGYKSLWK